MNGPQPDAIVCGADIVTLGLLTGIDAVGGRVPGDILVAGFDNIVSTTTDLIRLIVAFHRIR